MAAISKAWVDVGDGSVDPDSPGTTTLFTALRDDLIHLREWLGKDFYAGAVQNHRHDGVDSALVPVGPNMLRNGSFEDGEGGWTFTDFSGGSHAISAANHRHGAKLAEITSTVVANGGGEAVDNEFMVISEGTQYVWEGWVWASVANVSSRVEVIWYDNAQAQVSAAQLLNQTNTPTSPTFSRAVMAAAPANARFARFRITGGVPGAGSAAGTVRFDGLQLYNGVSQGSILDDAVGQAQLKTTTASGATAVTSGNEGAVALTGGTHSWWTASADVLNTAVFTIANTNQAAGVLGIHNQDSAGRDFNRDERYVQASPPYTHGPTFVFLMIDSLGNIVNIEVGFDPPWAYHGPTDIRPQRVAGGRAFRRVATYDGMTMREVLASGNDTLIRAVARGDIAREIIEREITLAYKDSDKDIVPHHWIYNRPGYFIGRTVVILEPGTALMGRLEHIAEESHAREVRNLIRRGYLNIDNQPITITRQPAGVTVVAASWKLTA